MTHDAGDASLVCRRDAQDIADKLLALLRDEELHAKLAAAAKRAAEPHTMGNYAKTLYGIYEQVIAGNAADLAGDR